MSCSSRCASSLSDAISVRVCALTTDCAGIPHNAMEDDGYRGYHIAGGTMVIPNMWSVSSSLALTLAERVRPSCLCRKMTQDPTCFPQPEVFRPERWLDRHTAEACNPRKIVFGFGRRVCPGREFAEASIWLAAACMLALFDISKATDRWGKEITPSGEYTSGFVR